MYKDYCWGRGVEGGWMKLRYTFVMDRSPVRRPPPSRVTAESTGRSMGKECQLINRRR